MNKLAAAGRVLSWCASCYVQFTEVIQPAQERAGVQIGAQRAGGSRPFE